VAQTPKQQEQINLVQRSYEKLVQKHRKAILRLETELGVQLKPVEFIVNSILFRNAVSTYYKKLGYLVADTNYQKLPISVIFAPVDETMKGILNPNLVTRPTWNWERLRQDSWIPSELFEKRISEEIAILDIPFSGSLEQQVLEIAILQQLYQGRLLREDKPEFSGLLYGFVSYKVSQAIGEDHQVLTNSNETLLSSIICFESYETENILKQGESNKIAAMLRRRLPEVYKLGDEFEDEVMKKLRFEGWLNFTALDTARLQPYFSEYWLSSPFVPIIFKLMYVQKLAYSFPKEAESLALNFLEIWANKFQDKSILSQNPYPLLLFASTINIVYGENTQADLKLITNHFKRVGFDAKEAKGKARIVVQFSTPPIGYPIDFIAESDIPTKYKLFMPDTTGKTESAQRQASGGALRKKRIIFIPLLPLLFLASSGSSSSSDEGKNRSPLERQKIEGTQAEERSAKSGNKVPSKQPSLEKVISSEAPKDEDIEFLRKKVSGQTVWQDLLGKLSNKSTQNWDTLSIKTFNEECVKLLKTSVSDLDELRKRICAIFSKYMIDIMEDNPRKYFNDSLELPALLDIIDGDDTIRTRLRNFGYEQGLLIGECDRWIRIRCKNCDCSGKK
jgi:hypothetical protein